MCDWLPFPSKVTKPAGRDAEAFAIVNDLTQVISEPKSVPDRAGDKAKTLDLFLISNPSIYSPPTISSPLSNSDHCVITLRHHILLTFTGSLLRKESSTTTRLTGTPFALFTLLTLGLQAFQMTLTILLLSSLRQYFLAWIFLFPLLTSLVKRNSPKWFNAQCAKAVNNKNHCFKLNIQELLSSTHATLAPKPSKMPNHLLSNVSTTKSLPARLALAPLSLWPKLSPKTFANHLSLH